MFESHFGLSASPFQLSPDPRFFFESKGHKNALAYLRFGVYQQEGFIVVTGDIGAGKTTLVRTLIDELNADEVVAAQVLNTQLNDAELLSSICNAFGVPSPGQSKAQLLGSLEAFFTAVAASGRRSLLIIDEAQNLGHREVEELRMLSNFQIGNRALLQSRARDGAAAPTHHGVLPPGAFGCGRDPRLHRTPLELGRLGRNAHLCARRD
jgi:general secretion pathway protein A